MIVVFAELGGEKLLGKAREIADSVGDRVVALCASDADAQKLIYLGADEVQRAEVEEPGEWVSVISELFQNEPRIRSLIFPFNVVTSVIAGAVYARERKSIESFMDGADYFDGQMIARGMDTSDHAIQKRGASEEQQQQKKTAVITINVASVTPIFEDSSRYGKIGEEALSKKKSELSFSLEGAPEKPVNSLNELTVILGDDRFRESAEKISERYDVRFVMYSSEIEVVYGPCIAIEVSEKFRNLPEFKGDLISLNTKQSAINTISDLAVISPEIDEIIESLSR
jgi:hypothetical protein